MSHRHWHILFFITGYCIVPVYTRVAELQPDEHLNVNNWTNRQTLEGHKGMLLSNQEQFFFSSL